MVFYNNILSVLVLLPLCWFNGGLAAVRSDNAVHRPAFLVAATASAAPSFGISYFSLWFLSTTTATVYSLVGSLNKVPLAVLGLVVFKTPATPLNLVSVAIGLVASGVFVFAKQAPLPSLEDRDGGGVGVVGGKP
jgi:GDP-mannose transporter